MSNILNWKKEDLVRGTVRFPKQLWKRVRRAADEDDLSIQEYLTQLLEKSVPSMIAAQKKRRNV